MCGILGVISHRGTAVGEAVRALQVIRHRGPDDEGLLLGRLDSSGMISVRGDETDPALEPVLPHWREHAGEEWPLIFGHRRLSILDLSTAGHQPMSYAAGRYWITYNGEVYNYRELRRELEAMGDTFASETDTEVILAAYARWGQDCVRRFIGMWAFAILDREERTVFLARGPFGIKPLYYATAPGRLAFCSEVKGLLALPWVSRKQDAQGVYEYLVWSRVENPAGTTLLSAVREVPPAGRALLRLSENDSPEVTTERYWNSPVKPASRLTLPQAADLFRALFLESVQLHLRSDVPVGAALSGGLDSSAIVCAMRQQGGPNLKIHAFSYIADDDRLNEEKWVDLAGHASAATVHKTGANVAELESELDQLIACQDLPFGSTSIYAQFRVFRLVQEHGIKVTMDGQGPDEMFAGYHHFRKDRAISLFNRGRWIRGWRMSRSSGLNPLKLLIQALMPQCLRPLGRRLFGRAPVPCWLNRSWVARNRVATGFKEPVLPRRERLRHTLQEALLFSSIPGLLRYEDRNSMHCSVESRVPYLTVPIAEAAMTFPEEFLLAPDGTTKLLLRHAMRGLVPDQILDRRDKVGFGTPEADWLRRGAGWVKSIFSPARLNSPGVFAVEPLIHAAASVLADRCPYDHWVWRVLNYVRWAEIYGLEPML